MSELGDRLFVGLQHLLPQHLLSNAMHAVARCDWRPLKRLIIKQVIRRFDVNMAEAREPDPEAYPTFNAFFTRELKQGARPLAGDRHTLVSPVDGAVSQVGRIDGQTLLQAKGRDYDLVELLAGDRELAGRFRNGRFATLYLSPRDYHRIHMPLAGELRRMVFVPGRLFSVNQATVRGVPRLFARNERLIAVFETEIGPLAVILVGAIFVGSMETVWAGEVKRREVTRVEYPPGQTRLARGEEMGRFNMGSTVILLLPEGVAEWEGGLQPDQPVKLGQALAERRAPGD